MHFEDHQLDQNFPLLEIIGLERNYNRELERMHGMNIS